MSLDDAINANLPELQAQFAATKKGALAMKSLLEEINQSVVDDKDRQIMDDVVRRRDAVGTALAQLYDAIKGACPGFGQGQVSIGGGPW